MLLKHSIVMKSLKYIFSILVLLPSFVLYSQTIELSFSGRSDSLHVSLDSILVENLTQGGDTTLYYPDTTLLLDITTGFKDNPINLNDFHINQNYPNPFMAHTSFDVYIPEDGHLKIIVYDISGKKLASISDNYRVGNHKFSFMTGKAGFYILSATFKNETHSIKMFSMGKGTYQEYAIDYMSSENTITYRKSIKAKKGINFSFGDLLRYVGYYNSLIDAKTSIPSQDTLIIFIYQSSQICFPTFIDARDGNVYSAVKIGDQCWMAENLNVGSRIDGVDNQSNNNIIEKYCYDDDTIYCDIYGGLYQWDEMMEFQIIEGSQGICPCGWHVPTDTSWNILTNFLGGNIIAGGQLKESGLSHWITPNTGATNSSGFTALPSGYINLNGLFNEKGEGSFFWSSSNFNANEARNLQLYYDDEMANPSFDLKTYGFSVRCLKDTIIQFPTKANGGPDTLIVSGDSIALMGNTPVYGKGLWSIFSGSKGYFADSTKPTTMFYGFPGMKYNLVWEIGNNCGNSSDTVIVQFDPNPNPYICGDPLIDTRNGLLYKTIRITDQCWMAENLNIGTQIISTNFQTDNGIIEKYCYDNNANYCKTYGGLYQWDEMMQYVTSPGAVGICPNGWHIPTNNEWKILEGIVDSQFGVGDDEWDYIGGWGLGYDVGQNLKSTTWNLGCGGTDMFGFGALPGGFTIGLSSFTDLYHRAAFWTSSPYDINDYFYRQIFCSRSTIRCLYDSDKKGFSVRCIRSCFPLPSQSYAGPDILNINSDTIFLMANQPINGQGTWIIISGVGGYISDSTNPISAFSGLSNTTYKLVWKIVNNCGLSTDTVLFNFANKDFICGDSIVDTRDWQGYKTAQIGSQCWMAENLNIGVSINSNTDQTSNSIIEKYCYNDSILNCKTFGGLYQWDEMIQYNTLSSNQGICPVGWHLSSETEWNILVNYLGGYQIAGGKLKESGYLHWISPNSGATNSSGFTALPAGYIDSLNSFNGLGTVTNYWSITDSTSSVAKYHQLLYNSTSINSNTDLKLQAFSVRCIKDTCSQLPTQANAGVDSFNIIGDSIILNANAPITGIGVWSIVKGNGGSFSDVYDPSSIFYGQIDSSYLLRWTISTSCKSSFDDVGISFSIGPIPCPGVPVVDYGGQFYSTVKIGNDCWMMQNLNIGTKIDGWDAQTNNGIIEKYCYNNVILNCDLYGGLYRWDELMNYDSVPGSQGICPPNWHVPTDEEWKRLEGSIDSYYNVNHSKWDTIGFRGFDAGIRLKDTTSWGSGNGIDLFRFSAQASGYQKSGYTIFNHIGQKAYFWSSSVAGNNTWIRYFNTYYKGVFRGKYHKESGFSVRCVLDCRPQPSQSNAGKDSLNIIEDSIMLSANIPQIGQGLWSIFYGTGGYFSDSTNPNSVFYGLPSHTYHLVWTITNKCGSSNDTVMISFKHIPCPSVPTVLYGGQIYNTVQIGTQCWMKENLNIGSFIDGNTSQTNNGIIEKHCYNHDSLYCDIYGGLYKWEEMMNYIDTNNRGICPSGWHIPTDEEWMILEGSVDSDFDVLNPEWNKSQWRGSDAGLNLKSHIGWSTSGRGTDIYGFSALPADYFTSFYNPLATFWTSTKYIPNSTYAYYRNLDENRDDIWRDKYKLKKQLSVRCLKDCSPAPNQADAGKDTLNIPSVTYVLQANNPINATGMWKKLSGTFGCFDEETEPTTTFYGLGGETYYLVWTISNSCGLTKDTVVISFATQAFSCGNNLVDIRNGYHYNTVQIGSQCWMAENLNIGNRLDSHFDQTNNGIIEKYCYNDIEDSCMIYGGLYQWNEMMLFETDTSGQGICPFGWHIPSDDEWKLLEGNADSLFGVNDLEWEKSLMYRGSDAGLNLKSINGWFSGGNGVDIYGFNTLPAGIRNSSSAFNDLGKDALFWTSTKSDSTNSWYRKLNYGSSKIYRGEDGVMQKGFSVRCIKGCLPQPTISELNPDSLTKSGNVITLMGNTPSIGKGVWSLISGIGGYIVDSTNPTSMFYGLAGQYYKLAWTISNSCGSSFDTVVIKFLSKVFVCGDTLLDHRDWNAYKTVQIGTTQCWMAENLNIGIRIDDTINQIDNNTIEKYCYNNNDSNCNTYGGLYLWDEVMNYNSDTVIQGVCPFGWHVPTDNDWKILEGEADSQFGIGNLEWEIFGFRGYDAGINLKATSGWYLNGNGLDLYSFSALPGGSLNNPTFGYLYSDAVFWSSTKSIGIKAIFRSLSFSTSEINRNFSYKEYGFSVRCLMDCWPQPTQANAGHDSSYIVGDSIMLYGNAPIFGQGSWMILLGTGGWFSDSTNPSTVFYGMQGVTYDLVWTIGTSCGSTSDTVKIAFGMQAFTCGDTITDTRDGKQYKTTKIGDLCWMSENLNIGLRIDGTTNQSDNGILEKYCYNDVEDSCGVYGGLYMWDEMMQYVNDTTTQGICPIGWRISTDYEWKVLEGTVDSQYGVGDPEWDGVSMRGFDAGLNLKSTKRWNSNGVGTDLFGYNALPGGMGNTIGTYSNVGGFAFFWTSSEIDPAFTWHRYVVSFVSEVARLQLNKDSRLSVRCLRD